MATQMQTFKKNLTKSFIKKGKMPDFIGQLAKQKDHWDAFVKYRYSELGIQWVQRNKKMPRRKHIITL